MQLLQCWPPYGALYSTEMYRRRSRRKIPHRNPKLGNTYRGEAHLSLTSHSSLELHPHKHTWPFLATCTKNNKDTTKALQTYSFYTLSQQRVLHKGGKGCAVRLKRNITRGNKLLVLSNSFCREWLPRLLTSHIHKRLEEVHSLTHDRRCGKVHKLWSASGTTMDSTRCRLAAA